MTFPHSKLNHLCELPGKTQISEIHTTYRILWEYRPAISLSLHQSYQKNVVTSETVSELHSLTDYKFTLYYCVQH